MADLAIWMAGHVTVPIYPSLKAQSIRQIWNMRGQGLLPSALPTSGGAEAGIPAGVTCVRFPPPPPTIGRLGSPGPPIVPSPATRSAPATICPPSSIRRHHRHPEGRHAFFNTSASTPKPRRTDQSQCQGTRAFLPALPTSSSVPAWREPPSTWDIASFQ
jgi:hypothetical protein